MNPIAARAVYIKEEAHRDPRSMARIDRILPFVDCEREPTVVDDAAWHQIVIDEGLNRLGRHGLEGDRIVPVVIFNQFLYHHTQEEREGRRERYPELFKGQFDQWSGYGGWDWRRTGDRAYREATGTICQPGYAMHSIWGCHFRCAYCGLGHMANVYVNLEDWVEHIRQGLTDADGLSGQRLFQWDNGADVSCWEPELGGSRLLVDLFAEQPDKYLLLYVGKSDNVDNLLGYDHKGHTICCWSLGTETQCRRVEYRTADMEARLAAARKCQEAGYTVRIRLSPMVPTAGWRDEVRHMIRRMFEEISPDLITMEPLRYMTCEMLQSELEPNLIDPGFMQAMAEIPDDAEKWDRSQFPDDRRMEMYRLVLDEVARLSPDTPVGLCREKHRVWEAMSDDFGRMRQHPDNYVCNCGPRSAGSDRRLLKVTA